MPPRCILSIARQNTRGAAHNTPANATRAKHHGKAAKTGEKAKLGSAQNGVALGAHAGAATRAGILAGPPYRANFNLPRHDRMPPFVRENLPTQRVKTAAKAGRNFPLFFPLCRYFPLHSRCYEITQKAHSTMHKRKALHRRKCKFAVQIWVSPPNVRILSRNAWNPFFFVGFVNQYDKRESVFALPFPILASTFRLVGNDEVGLRALSVRRGAQVDTAAGIV